MNVQAIQPFLCNAQTEWTRGSFPKPVPRLRYTAAIEDSPPRARPKVLEKPDQPSPAARARTAELGGDSRHDLTGRHARQGDVAIDVLVAKDRRIDPEELRHVVIPNVLEVPALAVVL